MGSALIVLGIVGIFLFRTPITGYLLSSSLALRGMADPAFSYAAFLSLRGQNEGLKAEVERLKEEAGHAVSKNLLEARVFSRFPANTRSSITVARGSEDGVKEGMPVFADAEKTLLVGRVARVAGSQSEVYTFFDSEWKSSVEVGSKKIKALLVGGNPAHIDLLPKDAVIAAGDPVINVSPDYPMGILMGLVGDIETQTNDIWQKAHLDSSVLPDALDRVFIATEFP